MMLMGWWRARGDTCGVSWKPSPSLLETTCTKIGTENGGGDIWEVYSY